MKQALIKIMTIDEYDQLINKVSHDYIGPVHFDGYGNWSYLIVDPEYQTDEEMIEIFNTHDDMDDNEIIKLLLARELEVAGITNIIIDGTQNIVCIIV